MSTFHFRPAIVTVAAMIGVTVIGFCFLWMRSGGTNPVAQDPYRVSFETDDVKNLQPAGDVRMAGVLIGKVIGEENTGDTARVTLELEDDVAPLHKGVTFRVGMKSLIGQSFVDVVDGKGTEVPAGTTLSAQSVIPAVDIDEVVGTFDPATRKALAGGLESLGMVAADSREDVNQLMDGVGRIGREGYTVVDAVAAQSEDLKRLVGDVAVVLAAIDGRRGEIAGLIDSSSQIAAATAAQEEDLRATVAKMPKVMKSAKAATESLGDLATDLEPVAEDLNDAAPDLNAALKDLPSATHSLRTLLPPMKSSLSRAPATINQLPTTSKAIRQAVPVADELLANANPMLEYLGPYAFDVGSFFGNFGSSFNISAENGVQPVRLAPIFNEYSIRNIPLDLQALNPLHWNNSYPEPKTADEPQKFTGTYTNVTKDE